MSFVPFVVVPLLATFMWVISQKLEDYLLERGNLNRWACQFIAWVLPPWTLVALGMLIIPLM